MGKIKEKFIKKAGLSLEQRFLEKKISSFEDIKLELNSIILEKTLSKRMRNRLAGFISKRIKFKSMWGK